MNGWSESVSDKPVHDRPADDVDKAERLDECLGLELSVDFAGR